MRVYIFDSGLVRLGHHLHFLTHALPTLRAAGHDVRVYGHKQVAPELRALGARPLFQISLYRHRSTDPYDGMLRDFHDTAKVFAEDLASLGESGPRSEDLVLMPTAAAREMLGFARWAVRVRVRPRVALLFHMVRPHEMEFGEGTLGGALHREAGRQFQGAFGERSLIGTTNERLAKLLSGPFGREVSVLPLPHWYGSAPWRAPEAGGTSRPVVAFLGSMRPAKGYATIPALVRTLRARGTDAEFVIHISKASNLTSDLSEYQALEREGLAMLVQRWLSEVELEELIASATLIVLPYGKREYSRMISGVFSFAAAGGRPCVVPAGTWMAEKVAADKAAGIAFEGETMAAIADAIERGLASREQLMRRAEANAEAWRRNSGPALMAGILDWAARA